MSLRIEDLDRETLEKLGLLKELPQAPNKPRAGLKIEDIRRHAIRVLAVLDKLNQSDRQRILEHAIKVNKI